MAPNFKFSAACCSTPAVIGPPYEVQGEFHEIEGLKTYISGAPHTGKALFVIYDVFGFSSQILQGADLLAAKGYRVFMPDFFEGKPAPMSWMPMADGNGQEPPVDEKSLEEFCEGPGNTDSTVRRVLTLRSQYQALNPDIATWGLVGYCWGGYVANFLLGPETPFSACVELHPGFPGKDIAETITKPILALCSKDEPETEYANFKPHLKVEARFEHFPSQVHGWMSSRGDLAKPEIYEAYQRGYDMLVEWFSKYIR